MLITPALSLFGLCSLRAGIISLAHSNLLAQYLEHSRCSIHIGSILLKKCFKYFWRILLRGGHKAKTKDKIKIVLGVEVRTYPQRKANGLVFFHTMWFPATCLSPQPLSWSGSRLSFLSTWQSAEGPKLGYFPEAGWVSTSWADPDRDA